MSGSGTPADPPSVKPPGKLRPRSWLSGIGAVLLLVCVFSWNHHIMHRYQIQKEDMSKRIAALQRQLSASQSSAMQAQFAHEEFKEIAKDEEEIRELRARVKELEGRVKGCKGGRQKAGRKGIGRHLVQSGRRRW